MKIVIQDLVIGKEYNFNPIPEIGLQPVRVQVIKWEELIPHKLSHDREMERAASKSDEAWHKLYVEIKEKFTHQIVTCRVVGTGCPVLAFNNGDLIEIPG